MSEENPWRTLSSDVRYDNPWIEVTHHDVLTPAGTPGIYGTVHFKTRALGVVVLDDDLNTWLVGQYRYALDSYSWEIPEGGGDPAIDPLLSIKRELKEDTGIDATNWRRLLEMDLSNSVSDEIATMYLATGLSFGKAAPEETESLTLRSLPFEDAYQMVLRGEIRDSMSVTAILHVKLLMLEGKL